MSPAYAFEQSCLKTLWQLSPENTPGLRLLLGRRDSKSRRHPRGGDPTASDPGSTLPPSSFCAQAPLTPCVTPGSLTPEEGSDRGPQPSSGNRCLRVCCQQNENGPWLGTLRTAPLCVDLGPSHTQTHSPKRAPPQPSQAAQHEAPEACLPLAPRGTETSGSKTAVGHVKTVRKTQRANHSSESLRVSKVPVSQGDGFFPLNPLPQ